MSPTPIFTPPTKDEIDARFARVRTAMAQEGLTHLVASCPDNVFYLTNFANYVHERPFILIIPLVGAPLFVVPKLEIPHVQMRAVGKIELVEYFEFPAPTGENWSDHYRSVFSAKAKVGLESTCPLQVYEATPGARVRSDIIEDVRMIKSDYEIGRISYASQCASEAMTILLNSAKPGVGLMEINSKCRGHMLLKTIADNPQSNMLATNATSVFQPPSISHDPHNFTDVGMVMETDGPNVSIINGTLNGYGTEVERTFFLGDVPETCLQPFETMMAARHTAFEMVKPGAVMSEVDKACNAVFKRAGYANNLLHRTGHSIGVTGHEGPFLAEGDLRLIEPGMVFTIEPGVYLPGIGGFRHSDTVLVTNTGNISLTPVPASFEDMCLPA